MSSSEGEKVEIVLSSSILALAVYTGQGPDTVHVYTHQEYLHERRRCIRLYAGFCCIAPQPFARFMFYLIQIEGWRDCWKTLPQKGTIFMTKENSNEFLGMHSHLIILVSIYNAIVVCESVSLSQFLKASNWLR